MELLWIGLALLVVAAGVRHWLRVRTPRSDVVDDDAVRRIIDEGRFSMSEDDAPLDLDEIAREEESFWSENWDEPEEL